MSLKANRCRQALDRVQKSFIGLGPTIRSTGAFLQSGPSRTTPERRHSHHDTHSRIATENRVVDTVVF
jgi:hypothetical protein